MGGEIGQWVARLLPLTLACWSPSPHPTAISGTEANFPMPSGRLTSQDTAWNDNACLTSGASQEASVPLKLLSALYKTHNCKMKIKQHTLQMIIITTAATYIALTV